MQPLRPVNDPKEPKPGEGPTQTPNEKKDALILSLIEIERRNHDAQEAEYKRAERREKCHRWMTGVEIFLIAVYAGFTIAEWSTFNSERKTFESEFKNSLKSSELEQRPWVSISRVEVQTYRMPFSVPVSLNFSNSGKTPAYMDEVQVSLWISDVDSKITQTLVERTFGPTGHIAPSGTSSFNNVLTAPVLTPTDNQKWQASPMRHVTVKIHYHDVFMNRGYTECRYAIFGNANQPGDIIFQEEGGGRME